VNIRNIISQLPILNRKSQPVEQTIKSENATDRDGNGQQQFQKQNEKQRPMTEEELKKAMTHLSELEVVKTNQWTVKLQETPGGRWILLSDAQGELIRKIPEAELWTLQVMQQDPSQKGQLLRKIA